MECLQIPNIAHVNIVYFCVCLGCCASVSRAEILKSIVFRAEKVEKLMREETKRQNKQIDQVVQILDMDGFGRKHMWLPGQSAMTSDVNNRSILLIFCMVVFAGAELVSDMLHTIDSNYPEMLYRTYVVNGKNY